MGASSGGLASYAVGFVLSIVLTAIAFALVMSGEVPRLATIVGLFAAAAAQILVHLHFFLHLNRSSAARWNVLALLFTLLVMFLFIAGTLWIMHNLDYRMM
jgi:cytochrome o ubiquinol oxidase subunit IV